MPEQNVRINFIANVKQLKTSLKTAGDNLKSFGKEAGKIGKTLSTRLSAPLALAGGMALKQAANFEKLQTTLNVLTGSAEEGAKAFERLVQFSAKTPFQLDELVKANNTMMGFGLSAEDAYNSLQQLGDIAAVAGGDLNRIAVAFGQSAAEGRVMTRDILQFINNGVPMYELLADVTGKTAGEVRQLASEGKITFEVLQAAFERSTQEGGKFHNGMKTLSGTLNGLFSTLKDNVNIAFAELGQEIAKAFNLSENIPKITKFIGDLVKKFKELHPNTKRAIIVIGTLATILPPLILAFQTLYPAIVSIAGGFKLLTTAIATNPIGVVIVSIIALKHGIDGLNESLGVANSKWQTFKNLLKSGGNAAQFAALQLKTGTKVKKEDASATDTLADSIKNVNSVITKGISQVSTQPLNLGIDEKEVERTKILGEKAVMHRKNMLDETFAVTEEAQGRLGKVSSKLAGIFDKPLEHNTRALDNFNNRMEAINERTRQIVQAQSEIVSYGLQDMAVGIGEALGQAIAEGGNLAGKLGSVLLGGIGSMAIQLGKLAIQIGIGIKAIKKAFESLNPVVAIAAGIALIALGSMFKSKAAKIGGGGGVKKFAKGGIVSTPTLGLFGEYPGARSNPEVVAPLDKLKGMIGNNGSGGRVEVGGQFVLKGQDLVVALQRAERNRDRIL